MARLCKVVPCLWFDKEAEEAANFYVSVFPNSSIIRTTRYSGVGQEIHGKPEGTVMTVMFALNGHEFTALNGGPKFKFDEAISLQILCETQEEVDYFWDKLTAGGTEGPCGWLTDRYGLSWQVTPTVLLDMLNDPDPRKAQNVMSAVFGMKKLDIAAMRRAYSAE